MGGLQGTGLTLHRPPPPTRTVVHLFCLWGAPTSAWCGVGGGGWGVEGVRQPGEWWEIRAYFGTVISLSHSQTKPIWMRPLLRAEPGTQVGGWMGGGGEGGVGGVVAGQTDLNFPSPAGPRPPTLTMAELTASLPEAAPPGFEHPCSHEHDNPHQHSAWDGVGDVEAADTLPPPPFPSPPTLPELLVKLQRTRSFIRQQPPHDFEGQGEKLPASVRRRMAWTAAWNYKAKHPELQQRWAFNVDNTLADATQQKARRRPGARAS